MIFLNPRQKTPLYQQLYDQMKRKIIAGEWGAGKRLPALRTMAQELCVSRNTVENAYGQLSLEGYVTGQRGSGFVVQDIQETILYHPDKTSALMTGTEGQEPPSRPPARELSAQDETHYKFDFQYGNFPADDFPRRKWKRLTAEVLASLEAENLCHYGARQGEPGLRRQIIESLRDSRGIHCSPEQVVLCSGLQDALALICLLFNGENRIVAMEDPGYDFTRIVFKNHNYPMVPIPVGDSGISLEKLNQSQADMVYITPSHQFPTGCVMPVNHRLELLQWAERVDGIILEDDYDSELRYHARPVPALQSIDRQGRVVYLGTFSKALSPALRTGYLILPQRLLARYDATFTNYKSAVPWLQQQVLTRFMAEGHWEKHLRKVCLRNKKKHDVLVRTIHETMGRHVRIRGAGAGLHVLLEFRNETSQDELIRKAAAHRVKVYPTRPYWFRPEQAPDGLVLLGFGGLKEEEIDEGVQLLSKAWL